MAEIIEKKTEERPENASRPASDSDAVGDINLSERGRGADGKPIFLDRRIFMQFMAFGNGHWKAVAEQVSAQSLQAVVYQDINDPFGVGLLAYHEDPNYFVDELHPLLHHPDLASLQAKPEYTMLGRSYTIGYESDLEEVLLQRPVTRACDPAIPWVVWYPVRRSGQFERQSREDQRKMLMEHGGIGHAYGKAGYATDIRLAAHGLNKDDNDFIVGLLGKELFPLSALVQHMRRTRQTSEFIQSMGPFFIGRAVWQPPLPAGE